MKKHTVPVAQKFSHLFNKYLLSSYYMPVSLVGARENSNSCLLEPIIESEHKHPWLL